MANILAVETSSSICSVALMLNNKIICEKQSNITNSHSSQLSVLIKEILVGNEITASKINSFAVSAGPGSYTGLRIGVSLIKGLCFATNKPLIAINTLEAIAYNFIKTNKISQNNSDILYCPVIDARRNEVYFAIYNNMLHKIISPQPIILTEESFSEHKNKKIIFIGNGADKCKNILNITESEFFNDILPTAESIAELALKKYNLKQFADLAYFEPVYLKDFVAIKSTKNIF